ncbi:GNAT family N-acetyltransferase [Erwinia sp. CPCC 100877]|nr:GNAT family N-acetyltransferase [Erwinia sp. CPCC 100877]
MPAKKILENEQLFLREMTIEDLAELSAILQDEATMYAYEAPFTMEKVQEWLAWNLTSYQENGFGLWAIIDKSTRQFIGQCGIVYSDVEGEKLLEIGYLVNKRYWNQGYASAASLLCLDYAAFHLKAKRICSIIRDTNIPSQKVAIKNGLQVIQAFDKDYSGLPVRHLIYSIDLTKYKRRKW